MPRVDTIRINIQTGNLSGAGTDGDVYVGVCGREFSLDTTRDDFERGSSREYVLGAGANVNNAPVNDPRKQILLVENVDSAPVFIRFQPRNRSDNWAAAGRSALQRRVLSGLGLGGHRGRQAGRGHLAGHPVWSGRAPAPA